MDKLPEGQLSNLFQDATRSAASDDLHKQLSAEEPRYDILDELGRGSRKRVERARDRFTGREVAFATLLPPVDDEKVERFLREGRMLAQLQHPSIIPVYDVGVSDEYGAYTVMRPARQGSLDEVVQARRSGNSEVNALWPLARRLEVVARVCDGVAYAHSRGVVHLDIKPSNILLGEFGEALLSDWGVARILDSLDEDGDYGLEDEELGNSRVRVITQHGVVRGTPGYMSPEQMLAEDPSTACDIYGIGATLYALLIGATPVTGRDFDAIFDATVSGDIRSPNERRPDFEVPPELDAIVMKALARDPIERYASVADLRHDLDLFRLGYNPEAHAAGGVHRLRLMYRRQRVAMNLALLALAIIIGLSVSFVRTLNKERRDAVTARLQAEESLNSLDAERSRRIDQGLVMAPRMLTEAKDALRQQHYERALSMASATVTMNPDLSAAQRFYGDLSLAAMDMEEAIRAYSSVNKGQAGELLQLAEAYSNFDSDPASMARLFTGVWTGLTHHSRQDLLVVSGGLAPFDRFDLEQQMELRLKLLEFTNPKVKQWQPKFTVRDGLVDLSLAKHSGLSSLAALTGAPIRELDISQTAVTDRSVVTTMPIQTLIQKKATNPHTKDLQGSSIRVLDLSNSRTRWLNALAGMEIEALHINNSPALDFEPLLECPKLSTVHISSKQAKHARTLPKRITVKVVK